jgi:CRISPR-associated protein Cas2
MLMIVAYDIMDPRRLQQVAKHCEDYGIRVQYSVFECRLKTDEFDRFWQDLCDLIDPQADRLVSYRICARCAQEVRMAGTQEVTSDARPVAYVF